MKIKMTFFINDEYLDIKIDKKYELIAGGLLSVRSLEAIDAVILAIENANKTPQEIISAIENIKKLPKNRETDYELSYEFWEAAYDLSYEFWEAGYNSTYINIKKNRVRIVDSSDYKNLDKHLEAEEDDDIKSKKISGNFTRYTGYIDIEINLFKKMLLEWRKFVKNTDKMTYSQRKFCRKTVEFN